MKLRLLVIVCAATALCASFGPIVVRGAAPQSDGEKIAILEKDLRSTRERAEGLAKDLKETRDLLNGVVHYLQAQAVAAQNVGARLDESEAAGFTAGINPRSREILMAAWREQIAETQKILPGSAPADAQTANETPPR